MTISHKKIRLLDRASLAVSFAGLVLAGLTHQALFALTPLSINAIIGLLRREGLEKKNEAHKYLSNSIDTEKEILLIGLKFEKIERKIEEERANTESKIVRQVEQLVSTVPQMKLIEQVVDKSVKIQSAAIKYSLEAKREERLSPLESKLQIIDRKISNTKAEIDAKLVPINERLSFISKINLLEQLMDGAFQEQRELIQAQRDLIQLVSAELRSNELMLVSGRKESRAQLIKALTEATTRLTIVCPWIRKDAVEPKKNQSVNILYLIESALKRQVTIDIGWGHLNDLFDKNLHYNKPISRDNFLSSQSGKSGLYDGLEILENLAKKYPNLKLKMLGTHEKYLICDRAYAMIGSHNFLTSGDGSDAKELGLVTWNARTIKQLEERYDSVKVATKSASKC